MPAYAFPDKQSYDKMARVVRLRQGLEGGIRPQKTYPREAIPRLAKVTTAAIVAGGTGEVTFQLPDWTATAIVITDCVNDFPVELPVGTKCYIGRIAGSWRVTTPILECEPPA